MKFKIILVLALFLFASGFQAAIKNVPSQYSTIQSAINAAVNGDTVLVAPGTYNENINFRGKNIVVTGTYYQFGDPSLINSTIINGGSPVHPDTVSCVIISNHEDSTTVLQGFTITNGKGTLWDDEHATGNRYREGGGILIQYSSPIIQNNIIRNNEAINNSGAAGAGGGGIRMGDSNPKILNNIIMLNKGLYGPGLVLNYSGGTFKNNIIIQNTGGSTYSGGGAFWINGTAPNTQRLIENNTILNNTSSLNNGTGGILVSGSNIIARNNIIRGNTSGNNTQILVSGGSASVTYNNIQYGYVGAGNINLDPLFADSNYILQPGSPCVDKGDSSIIYNDLPDQGNPSNARYPSRGGVRNDIGAYGGPLAKLLTNQLIGINPVSTEIPQSFRLYQNYPNPFNPVTNIKFDIPENSNVTLTVYDLNGKIVSELNYGYLNKGSYNYSFNGNEISSGVYFYTLSSQGFSITRKMILVK